MVESWNKYVKGYVCAIVYYGNSSLCFDAYIMFCFFIIYYFVKTKLKKYEKYVAAFNTKPQVIAMKSR